MLSIFWSVYNMLPPSLFIFYCYQKGQIFEDFCSFCMTVSFLVAIGGITCTWLVPDDYNLGQVLNVSLQFYEAQRSGKLPRISNTPWRGNSGLWDSILVPGTSKNISLTGGWYDDGGMLKVSYSTAFTVSMLSWAYYEYKAGFKSSGNLEFGATTIRWGADYLMKATITNTSTNGASLPPIFVAQVGEYKSDRGVWTSPEKALGLPRTAMSINPAKGQSGTDLMAMGAAALASAAVAVQDESMQVAEMYLTRALVLYNLAQKYPGYYMKWVQTGQTTYPSSSMFDDLAYAACWIYIATQDPTYLDQAVAFYQQSYNTESHGYFPNTYMFNYENVMPALDVMLAKLTKEQYYKSNVEAFVKGWMNTKSKSGEIYYTQKFLAKAAGGTLQHTANAAFLVLLAARDVLDSRFMLYACWARNQIGYMLGEIGRELGHKSLAAARAVSQA